MNRDYTKLENEQFDMAIVGSGIHGAILAHRAAREGYRVALVEKGDFGGSTSANSLKIVHGGIRYLQHLDFKRMRESITSRRSMMHFAPHIVKPLPCLMPTYGHGLKGKEMMRIAFGLYDLIACDRNRGLPEDSRLPGGGALSLERCTEAIPGIEANNLNGAALWYDAVAVNTERLLLEYLLDAARYGAVLANYHEATELTVSGSRVSGITSIDQMSGKRCSIKATTVINTAGPWVDRLLGSSSSIPPVTSGKWAQAMNIVVKKRFFGKYAVGLEGWSDFIDRDAFIKRGKRLFFFVPWRSKYTMIGTSYKPYEGSPDSFALSHDDVEEMLQDINRIYPRARLSMRDVSFCHGGLLPRKKDEDENVPGDTVQLEKSTRIINHLKTDKIAGLISISGVKYTTAPDIADKVIRLLTKQGQQAANQRPSYTGAGSGAAHLDHGQYTKILGQQYGAIKRHLLQTYGSFWREVFFFVAQSINSGADPADCWISLDPPLLAAEISYFIEHEQAKKLTDVVFRRSSLGTAECPEPEVLGRICTIMAEKLGWDEERRAGEILAVHLPYTPLQS